MYQSNEQMNFVLMSTVPFHSKKKKEKQLALVLKQLIAKLDREINLIIQE